MTQIWKRLMLLLISAMRPAKLVDIRNLQMRMPKKKLVFLAKMGTDLFSRRRIQPIDRAKVHVRMKINILRLLIMVNMMTMAYRIKIAMMVKLKWDTLCQLVIYKTAKTFLPLQLVHVIRHALFVVLLDREITAIIAKENKMLKIQNQLTNLLTKITR